MKNQQKEKETVENIKNFDKLKTEEDREFVRTWSKITTITINDDGFYMLDIIPQPPFSDAKIKEKETVSDDNIRRSPYEIELERQIKLLEEIKEKIQNKIDCEDV